MEEKKESRTDSPSSFKCTVCWDVAFRPNLCSSCSNLVCSTCLPSIEDKRCPICRTHDQISPSQLATSRVKKLKLPCKNGCGDIISVGSQEDHTHSPLCKNKLVKCVDCQRFVQMRNLLDHMTGHSMQTQQQNKKKLLDTHLIQMKAKAKAQSFKIPKQAKSQFFQGKKFPSDKNGHMDESVKRVSSFQKKGEELRDESSDSSENEKDRIKMKNIVQQMNFFRLN